MVINPKCNTVFVQSSLFNDTIYKIIGVFISMATGENRMGNKWRERERSVD